MPSPVVLARLLMMVTVLVLVAAPAAWAVNTPSEMLSDPVAERRAEAIGHQLRCVVCQNESVEESEADLAHDMRRLIRTRVTAGDSDQAVIDWMVAHYGTFIRLSPPLQGSTVLLWAAPVLALLVGAAALYRNRHRFLASGPASLTDAERSRLERLLGR